jgi:surfeit locus 1 family protein
MKFRFRPVLTVAVAISLALLVSLGVWQLQRLEWKRAIIAQISERLASAPIAFSEATAREATGENMEYQPVFVDGVYANDTETPVFGTYEGAAGVYVFTPFALSGDGYVFVNRGFAPQDVRARSARADGDVAGAVRVEGLLRHKERRVSFAKWLTPRDQPEDNLFFTRDPATLAAARGIDASEFYIDSSGKESAAPWPKGGLTRIDIPNRHLEYALTWFGLAAALIGVFAVYSVRQD